MNERRWRQRQHVLAACFAVLRIAGLLSDWLAGSGSGSGSPVLPRHPPSSPLHPPQGREAQPSKRYLTLIREGAADYGLSADYRGWLEGLQHYEATTPGQKLGVWIFRLVAFVGIFPVFAGGCRCVHGVCYVLWAGVQPRCRAQLRSI